MLTVSINTSEVKKLLKEFQKIDKDTYAFFGVLGAEYFKMTMANFKMLGGRSGHPQWRKLSLLSMHPSWKAKKSAFPEYKGKRYNPKKWNRRRGTDNAKSRFYNDNSDKNILQAGGSFRNSFTIQSVTNKKLVFGTTQKIGDVDTKDIIQDREVLFVNDKDKSIIGRMFMNFVKEKLK